MSTNNKNEPDYEAYLQHTPPEPEKRSGLKEREQRRLLKTQKEKITIRLDQEVLDEFRQLAPEGKGYQNLINLALREWLSARGIKELVKEELTEFIGVAVESIKHATASREKGEFPQQP